MLRLLATGLLMTLALPAVMAQERGPWVCAGGERVDDMFQGLSPQGDIILLSGRAVSLSGIRLPEESPTRDQALARLTRYAGRPVLIRVVAERDRWDRVTAELVVSDEAPPLDLARDLVVAGLAVVDAGTAETLCQPELLRLEEQARTRSLGVWAQERYKPIDVLSVDRLRERIGTFALVEGHVRSIGERQQRAYLNFGANWAEDFTITISKRTWTRMAERGLAAASLKGSRIRARGILEEWQGVALAIKAPEMIEWIEDPPRRR